MMSVVLLLAVALVSPDGFSVAYLEMGDQSAASDTYEVKVPEGRLSPSASGVENADALQRMLDAGGRVLVSSEPGDYKIARTLLIGDDTTLECASGVRLVKSDEVGPFSQVILNRGARGWVDENGHLPTSRGKCGVQGVKA